MKDKANGLFFSELEELANEECSELDTTLQTFQFNPSHLTNKQWSKEWSAITKTSWRLDTGYRHANIMLFMLHVHMILYKSVQGLTFVTETEGMPFCVTLFYKMLTVCCDSMISFGGHLR